MGLSSYLLIGFWFEKDSAANASKKAFLTTRVGDVGMFIGIMILFLNTPSSFRPNGGKSGGSPMEAEEGADALNIRVNLCLFDLIDDILSLVNIVVPKEEGADPKDAQGAAPSRN